MRWSDWRALIATGSPFDAVPWKGRRYVIGQGNNAFAFPGIGLGALACSTRRITDNMLWGVSRAIAHVLEQQDAGSGALYPTIAQLPKVTRAVPEAVAKAAVLDRVARVSDWADALTELRWVADYPELRPIP